MSRGKRRKGRKGRDAGRKRTDPGRERSRKGGRKEGARQNISKAKALLSQQKLKTLLVKLIKRSKRHDKDYETPKPKVRKRRCGNKRKSQCVQTIQSIQGSTVVLLFSDWNKVSDLL